MADYNPNAPMILGVEWPPIRQADYVPDSVLERGYITRIDHAVTPVSGAVAVNALPPQSLQNSVEFVSIYRATNALNTGPARVITIPAESITITGAKITSTTGSYTALTNPNDVEYVGWLSNAVAGTDSLGINFAVTDVAVNELAGKRILGVRLKYTAAGGPQNLASMITLITRAAATSVGFNYQTGLDGAIDLTLNTDYGYVDFGEYNPLWKDGVHAFNGMEIFPWRQTELLLFDTSASIASRLMVVLTGSLDSSFDTVRLGYAALEVTYCEETRVLYGGRRAIADVGGFPINSPGLGDNLVQFLNTSFQRNTTSLTPDDYLITTIHKAVGNYVASQHPPTYAALRELTELPSLPSVALRQPQAVGETLAEADIGTTTPVALWTASTAITGAHPYADQIAAPVFGNAFVRQRINGRSSMQAGTTTYPQIRFYARRSAGTTIPLTVLDIATSQSTDLTVDAFDELPEIIDGWREVTLRTAGISVSGTGRATVHLICTGAVAGSQWQVLGARAETTGVTEREMTYDGGSTAGTATEIVGAWQPPTQLSTGDDVYADFTIMLSQDPPTVSGFTVSQGSLVVTGIGVECGVPSDCIPTGVGYTQLSWTPQPAGCDTFSYRTLTDEWGAMETGQDYTLVGGTNPGNYDVANGVGTHTLDTVGSTRRSIVATPTADNYVSERIQVPVVAVGGSIGFRLSPRYVDGSNHYFAEVLFNTDNTVTLRFAKFVASANTTLTVQVAVGTYGAGSWYGVTTRMVGSRLEARAWEGGAPEDEPTTWQIAVDDTSFTNGSNVAWISYLATGNTNTLPVITSFDDLYTVTAGLAGGRLQIDRMDEEDLVWQTIVDTENFCITGVQDLEARVGVQNWYRARLANAGDFWGPYVSGTGTIPAPGVEGVTDANSVLIFTSNRAPLATLAYVMVWDDRPVEGFAFPEADTQTLQRMYNRDFQVAFRPLERGGEQFDRTILVQAAAIPVESLANFINLRDLAWAELPYVCVRDELGNRWYANVLVPSGIVRRNRRLYLGQIRVTEVTDTPAPVE